jgi:hypothetical protein
MVWDVGGGWRFEPSGLSFYAVARVGVFRGMTRSVPGRVSGRLAPMCCLHLGIPSI